MISSATFSAGSPSSTASPSVIATRTGSALTFTYIMAIPSSAIRCTPKLVSPGPTMSHGRRPSSRRFGKKRCPTGGLERMPRPSFTAACTAACDATGRRLDLGAGVGEVCFRGFVAVFSGVRGSDDRLLRAGRVAAVSLASSPARSPIRRLRSANSRNTDAICPSSRSIAVPRILVDASRMPPLLLLSMNGERRATQGQSKPLDSLVPEPAAEHPEAAAGAAGRTPHSRPGLAGQVRVGWRPW